MKESVVLLCDLTPTCTELARHLVLSGINLSILVGDANSPDSDVTQNDTQSDFLFSPADIGYKKCEVVKKKLTEMNPFVKIEFCTKLDADPRVSIILSSIQNFKKAVELNQAVRNLA